MRVFSRPLIIASLSAVAISTASFAFTTVGNGRLVGSATARADYDSNVFVSNSEVDDVVATGTGQVRYVRDGGLVTLDAGAGLTLLGFVDHDELNSADPFADARVGYQPSDKTEAEGLVSIRRSTIGNETVNARTKSDDFLLQGSFEHLTTEKLGFRVTGDYAESAYLTPGYSDTASYSFGFHGVHAYSPKLKLLAGVTRIESWTDVASAGRRSPSSRDWRYAVGAEGEFAPKLTGEVSAGLIQRSFKTSGFENTDEFYFAGRIAWAAADKTTWSLVGNQNLGVTAADQSVKSSALFINVQHQLSAKITGDASVGVDRSEYVGFRNTGNRTDDGYTARARLVYTMRDNVEMDVSSGYRKNNSTVRIADYDRVSVGAGITVRF